MDPYVYLLADEIGSAFCGLDMSEIKKRQTTACIPPPGYHTPTDVVFERGLQAALGKYQCRFLLNDGGAVRVRVRHHSSFIMPSEKNQRTH